MISTLTGQIIIWPLPQTPYGFMSCDGSLVSVKNYPKLYAVLGNYYNAPGDPAGYFRLPNFDGHFVLGTNADNAVGDEKGQLYQDLAGTQAVTSVQDIDYWVDANGNYYPYNGQISVGTAMVALYPQRISIIPKSIVMKFVICYDGQ